MATTLTQRGGHDCGVIGLNQTMHERPSSSYAATADINKHSKVQQQNASSSAAPLTSATDCSTEVAVEMHSRKKQHSMDDVDTVASGGHLTQARAPTPRMQGGVPLPVAPQISMFSNLAMNGSNLQMNGANLQLNNANLQQQTAQIAQQLLFAARLAPQLLLPTQTFLPTAAALSPYSYLMTNSAGNSAAANAPFQLLAAAAAANGFLSPQGTPSPNVVQQQNILRSPPQTSNSPLDSGKQFGSKNNQQSANIRRNNFTNGGGGGASSTSTVIKSPACKSASISVEEVEERIARLISENDKLLEPSPVLLKRRSYTRQAHSSSLDASAAATANVGAVGQNFGRSLTAGRGLRSQSLIDSATLPSATKNVGNQQRHRPSLAALSFHAQVYNDTNESCTKLYTCRFCNVGIRHSEDLKRHEEKCGRREENGQGTSVVVTNPQTFIPHLPVVNEHGTLNDYYTPNSSAAPELMAKDQEMGRAFVRSTSKENESRHGPLKKRLLAAVEFDAKQSKNNSVPVEMPTCNSVQVVMLDASSSVAPVPSAEQQQHRHHRKRQLSFLPTPSSSLAVSSTSPQKVMESSFVEFRPYCVTVRVRGCNGQLEPTRAGRRMANVTQTTFTTSLRKLRPSTSLSDEKTSNYGVWPSTSVGAGDSKMNIVMMNGYAMRRSPKNGNQYFVKYATAAKDLNVMRMTHSTYWNYTSKISLLVNQQSVAVNETIPMAVPLIASTTTTSNMDTKGEDEQVSTSSNDNRMYYKLADIRRRLICIRCGVVKRVKCSCAVSTKTGDRVRFVCTRCSYFDDEKRWSCSSVMKQLKRQRSTRCSCATHLDDLDRRGKTTERCDGDDDKQQEEEVASDDDVGGLDEFGNETSCSRVWQANVDSTNELRHKRNAFANIWDRISSGNVFGRMCRTPPPKSTSKPVDDDERCETAPPAVGFWDTMNFICPNETTTCQETATIETDKNSSDQTTQLLGSPPKTELAKFDASAMIEGKAKCQICAKEFAKTGQLRLHMDVHRLEQSKRRYDYKCPNCNSCFRSRNLLQKHLINAHPVQNNEEQPAFTRSSSKLQSTTTNSAAIVVSSATTTPTAVQQLSPSATSNPRPFECTDCAVAFRIHGHLAKHLRSKSHIMKLESLEKVPIGIFAKLEENSEYFMEIDTSDCRNSLNSLLVLVKRLMPSSTQSAHTRLLQLPVTSSSEACSLPPYKIRRLNFGAGVEAFKTNAVEPKSNSPLPPKAVEHQEHFHPTIVIPKIVHPTEVVHVESMESNNNKELCTIVVVDEKNGTSSRCKFCAGKFASAADLEVHWYADHILMRDGSYFKCPKAGCDTLYPNKNSLRAHLTAHFQGKFDNEDSAIKDGSNDFLNVKLGHLSTNNIAAKLLRESSNGSTEEHSALSYESENSRASLSISPNVDEEPLCVVEEESHSGQSSNHNKRKVSDVCLPVRSPKLMRMYSECIPDQTVASTVQIKISEPIPVSSKPFLNNCVQPPPNVWNSFNNYSPSFSPESVYLAAAAAAAAKNPFGLFGLNQQNPTNSLLAAGGAGNAGFHWNQLNNNCSPILQQQQQQTLLAHLANGGQHGNNLFSPFHQNGSIFSNGVGNSFGGIGQGMPFFSAEQLRCILCGKQCISPMSLQEHLMSHNPHGTRLHVCRFCDAAFTNAHALQAHLPCRMELKANNS